MPEPVTLEFVKKKETPGCVVFQEKEQPGKPPIVGSLYVKKWFAGDRTTFAVTLR